MQVITGDDCPKIHSLAHHWNIPGSSIRWSFFCHGRILQSSSDHQCSPSCCCFQWSPGQPEPESWKDYYTQNPCVPIDFPSIPRAIATVTESTKPQRGRAAVDYQTKSVRILLRPGTYYLREAIQVHTYDQVDFSMETMAMPNTLYSPPVKAAISEIAEQPLPPTSRKNRPNSLRSLFACNQSSTTEESETDEMIEMEESFEASANTEHAKLVLRTRKPNEPVFTIRQGAITLRRLNIEHQASGVDIWNGNAAVQIQPPLGADGSPVTVLPAPVCNLESCIVSSKSGRGIVNIDGGRLNINKCMVRDCAATGIYIGGPGSSAEIHSTDVLHNGIGNRRTRRGIARGHSGIYLEQGEANITDSNVSNNTLTGISVVSPDNAVLSLRDSSLVANGTFQLELPAPGTRSHQQSTHENNQLEFLGVAQIRSGLSHEG